MNPTDVQVIGFAGYSGTGKTALLKQIIPLLKHKGLRVGLIKKSHHNFEIELHRPSLGKPLFFPADTSIIAIAKDGTLPVTPSIPQFDINSPTPISNFILESLLHHGIA